MIRLYHASRTRSVRVRWLLEELGISYDLHTLRFTPEVIKGAEYRKLNPLGKVPAMQDGELTMFESGAMVQYILETYGEGRLEPPKGTPARGKFLQWIHFAEATAMPPLSDMAQHMFFRPENERIPAMVEDGRRRILLVLDALEVEIQDKDFLLGPEFTAADIMMGYTLMLSQLFGVLGEAHPALGRYYARLAGRPAFQKAIS